MFEILNAVYWKYTAGVDVVQESMKKEEQKMTISDLKIWENQIEFISDFTTKNWTKGIWFAFWSFGNVEVEYLGAFYNMFCSCAEFRKNVGVRERNCEHKLKDTYPKCKTRESAKRKTSLRGK